MARVSLKKWLKTNPMEPDPAYESVDEKLKELAAYIRRWSTPALSAGEPSKSRQSAALAAYFEANHMLIEERQMVERLGKLICEGEL